MLYVTKLYAIILVIQIYAETYLQRHKRIPIIDTRTNMAHRHLQLQYFSIVFSISSSRRVIAFCQALVSNFVFVKICICL